jgi:hypothetical protein
MISILVSISLIILIIATLLVLFILHVKRTRKEDRKIKFNWLAPLCVAMGTLIFFSLFIIYGPNSAVLFIMLMILISIILIINAFVLALFKKWRTVISVFALLLIDWGISWCLLKIINELHEHTQWLLDSNELRSQLMRQPNSVNGEFKHIDWYGWGFLGMDTEVYIVFDPKDSLAVAAKSHSSGKFNGIPCGINRVRRLENHYYTVSFYIDTNWDHCN